ncbi:hypothetical protein RRG08_038878 [Elysia crispata]|uniref:Uncharacterized protein n=1 Tax=Elysia crispata TaxID=231223 RepID=A0AAE1D3V2_9GAST|nr:hypothetical protein RRG08_038878 [Elysia crispata]
MVINEIRLNEDSRRVQKAVQQPQQGQWTNWDNALQKSLTWNEIWHMAPLRISFLIRSVYDLLPSNSNLLLDGCDDWDVSANLPEWDSHPSIIKETRLRPDIVIRSASTQQLITVELTVPYENKMEEADIYKREKYMNLNKELENAGYKAVVMPEDQLAKWYSAGISNPSRDEGMGSNPGAVQKKRHQLARGRTSNWK